MMLGELPVDVLSKIVANKLGDLRYIKLKHSRALKRIQVMFKLYNSEPVIERDENNVVNINIYMHLKYGLMF